ncbi:YbhB/YbcL family Raf kinase inhibitor-like protein [Pseudomonas syringae]|nr:YbhB/YbcL family Raf kinase inhibitor-like protein [Pseudomonas syringae]MCQ3030917.1 YbhB/YbcL family Raf kinase inhibitor-like protein [Pseudomonas syringae]MDG6400974.1 YbhB/YbcL family Raf kinase inhibitor-like protein [Pseudomonas quasicaspiana]
MLSRLLGRVLRGRGATENKLIWNHKAVAFSPVVIDVRSPAFASMAQIPLSHVGSAKGGNLSPPLVWEGLPTGTKELVLIIEDADAPIPFAFVHAIAIGISPQLNGLPVGALSSASRGLLTLGRNTFGGATYIGPQPLVGHGPHRYSFQLLALDRPLDFDSPPNRNQLLKAIDGAVIGRGRLDGIHERA